MKEIPKILESRMKIQFHDCDPFNHLNNSRYIDYIMTARTDQLLEFYELDIYRIAEEQLAGWVTAQTQISYLSPALPGEEVVIQTRMVAYSEKSLAFEGQMWSTDKKALKAVLWTKLVHVDLRTQRSIRHADALMQFFELVIEPVTGELTFDERVSMLRPKI